MSRHPRDVFGVSAQASEEEIRKRYKKLMLRYHPDRLMTSFPDETQRAAALQESETIQWAYVLLLDPVKLKAYETASGAALKTIDLSYAIEYLDYDDEGRVIGQVARQSDRYRKLFNKQVEKFKTAMPSKATAEGPFRKLIQTTVPCSYSFGQSRPFYSVYEFIAYQESSKADIDFEPPALANDYTAILNVFRHFFKGHYYGRLLEQLKSDLSSLLETLLDARIKELLTSLSTIIELTGVDAEQHYAALECLFNVMYAAIESDGDAAVKLLADKAFKYYVNAVQSQYLLLKRPKHLTKKWLSEFHSDKPQHMLDKNTKTQTYADLEKDFATAFKEDDPEDSEEKRAEKNDVIMEQACKQVDISEVTFTAGMEERDDEDADEEVGLPKIAKKVRPIRSTKAHIKHFRSARIGKANHYLMSAISYQVTAQSEITAERKAAAEYVALDLYRSAFFEVRKSSHITRLYVYFQVLAGVLALEYQGDMAEELIAAVYQEFSLISQFIPLISMPISHNDLDRLTAMDEKWLYKVLDYISTSEDVSIEERTQAAYLLFDGTYSGVFPPEDFDKLRLRCIETYLQSKNMSISDISEFVHPANSVLKRSPTGSVDPTCELNIPDISGGKIIADIRGFEINQNTGEIKFKLLYWEPGMPRSSRLMTEKEFYEMLQYNIDLGDVNNTWFTLDQPETAYPHLPLQHARSNLPNIPAHQTMLDTDYVFLKFLTTGSVSGVYPFDFEDTAEMISHLPQHLIDVLMTLQNNSAGYFYTSTDPSRFWHKTTEIERSVTIEGASIVCRVGDAPIELDHQKMFINLKGEMKDDLEEDELGLIINKALKNSHELKTLIGHAVDPQERQVLLELLEDYTEQEAQIKQYTQQLRALKQEIQDDESIPLKSKQSAFASRSRPIMANIGTARVEIVTCQKEMKPKLHLALDLNKVFARRVTEHMNELMAYIPMLGRFRLFSKLDAIQAALIDIQAQYSSNSKMMQQLNLLKINKVDPPKFDPDKKVFVPAAIHRDAKGGLICFGGGLRYRNYIAERSETAKKDVLSELGRPWSFSAPDASSIRQAEWKLTMNSSKMLWSDREEARQAIYCAERDLRHQEAMKLMAPPTFPIFNFNDFGIDTRCFPTVESQPEFVPACNNIPTFSAPSYTPPTYTPPTYTAPPVHPQPTPVVQATPVSVASVPSQFLLPPTFDEDPYVQTRVASYHQETQDFRAEIPVYQAASYALSKVPTQQESHIFKDMHDSAVSVISDVVAPVINKFVGAKVASATLDPICSLMVPQSLTTFVSTVIAVAHMPERHPSLVESDYQLAKESVRQCPSLYDYAKQQLQEATENSDILVPGCFAKTAEAFKAGFESLNGATSLNDLGVPPRPPLHHPQPSPDLDNLLAATVTTYQHKDDLGKADIDSLLYVVTNDGELSLQPYVFGADAAINNNKSPSYYLDPNSRDIKMIQAMGTVDLSEDHSVDIVHIAEKYNDEHVKPVIIDAFQQQGFGDVANAFIDNSLLLDTGDFNPVLSEITRERDFRQRSFDHAVNYVIDLPNVLPKVLDGIGKGARGFLYAITHPDEAIIKPIASLGLDTLTVMAYHMPYTDPYGIEPTAYVPEQFYIASAERMQERGLHLVEGIAKFATDLPSDQAETAAEFMTFGYLTGGTLNLAKAGFKPGQVVARAQLGRMQTQLDYALQLQKQRHWVDPKAIKFTQPSISPMISRNRPLGDFVDALKSGKVKATDAKIIKVVPYQGELYSLGNSRLAAFSMAELESVPVEVASLANPGVAAEFFDKLNPIAGKGDRVVFATQKQRLPAHQELMARGLIAQDSEAFVRNLPANIELRMTLDDMQKDLALYTKSHPHTRKHDIRQRLVNYDRFGMPEMPSTFTVDSSFAELDMGMQPLPKQAVLRSRQEVLQDMMRRGKEAEQYIYTISEDGVLSMTPKYTSQLKEYYHKSGEASHAQLAEKVVSAGEINFIRHNEWLYPEAIKSKSGHFKPFGFDQTRLNEYVLPKHDINIKGRFEAYRPTPLYDQLRARKQNKPPFKPEHTVTGVATKAAATNTMEAGLLAFGVVGMNIAWREQNQLPQYQLPPNEYQVIKQRLADLLPYAEMASDKLKYIGGLVVKGLQKMKIHDHSMSTLYHLDQAMGKGESPHNQLSMFTQSQIRAQRMSAFMDFAWSELQATYHGLESTVHLTTHIVDEAIIPALVLTWDSVVVLTAQLPKSLYENASVPERIAFRELYTILSGEQSLYQDSLARLKKKDEMLRHGIKAFWNAPLSKKVFIGTEVTVSVVATHRLFHAIKHVMPLLLRTRPLRWLNKNIFTKAGQYLADVEIGSIVLMEELAELAEAAKGISNKAGKALEQGIKALEKAHEYDHIVHSIHEATEHNGHDHEDPEDKVAPTMQP